jgi:hypothetical protein
MTSCGVQLTIRRRHWLEVAKLCLPSRTERSYTGRFIATGALPLKALTHTWRLEAASARNIDDLTEIGIGGGCLRNQNPCDQAVRRSAIAERIPSQSLSEVDAWA